MSSAESVLYQFLLGGSSDLRCARMPGLRAARVSRPRLVSSAEAEGRSLAARLA
jgi:hypothetical protein